MESCNIHGLHWHHHHSVSAFLGSTVAGYKNLGCWKDSEERVMTGKVQGSDSMTIEKCADICQVKAKHLSNDIHMPYFTFISPVLNVLCCVYAFRMCYETT